jgi:hypothetical protein
MPCHRHTPPTASMINLSSIIADYARALPLECGAAWSNVDSLQ